MIVNYSAGSVATVNDDGTPAVSPKATFVIVDDERIAFGDVRSPNTIANLAARPNVEVLFTDVLTRTAVRVAGTAKLRGNDDAELRPLFLEHFPRFLDVMGHLVLICVTKAQLITSPAYDAGQTREELRVLNLAKLTALD